MKTQIDRDPGRTPGTHTADRRAPSVLAIIPARGGSKGLPGKNLRLAGGKPLIAWSIEAALGARCVTRTIVSTDDPEIARIAAANGAEVPFMRPSMLATDSAASIDVVLHALTQMPQHDYLLLLQPTSPQRTAADIDAAFALLRDQCAPSCVSVCPSAESPFLMVFIDARQRAAPVLPLPGGSGRRQDHPQAWRYNGAIYFASTPQLLTHRALVTPETVAYRMPVERSIDIDDAEDLRTFEQSLTGRAPKPD